SLFLLSSCALHLYLHSFPTRRSSDLQRCDLRGAAPALRQVLVALEAGQRVEEGDDVVGVLLGRHAALLADALHDRVQRLPAPARSEEHTSELQSRENLVCRLLLEKKK